MAISYAFPAAPGHNVSALTHSELHLRGMKAMAKKKGTSACELVLVAGFPAGGKTTVTKTLTDQGYTRLNRDTVGGAVDDLLPKLAELLAAGKSVVMDNLYATRTSRAGAIAVA